MSYGKVYEVFWEDEKIELLSDRATLMALFLISGPHRNAIGCFRLGIGAITDLPRFQAWGREGVSEALNELVQIGFIVRDDRTGWTLIANALKHDPIKQDKAAIHALSLATRVPKTSEVYQALIERLEPQLQPHAKALSKKEGWPLARPIEDPSETQPSPEPLPEPSPLPEPEPVRGADAPETEFAFVGHIIRLKRKDFEQWKEAYHAVPDIIAELRAADAYYAENPPKDGKWFYPVSSWLKRTHDRVLEERRKEQEAEDAIYAGVL